MALSPEIQQLLGQAMQYHRAGQLAEAEKLYQQVLARDAREVNALQLLGVLAHQVGRHNAAVSLISQAISILPSADAYVNLSQALRAMNRFNESLSACEHAVKLAPEMAEAHNNLGTALCDVGRRGESVAAFERAVKLRPNYVKALSNLATALVGEERLDEAEGALRRAVEAEPSRPQGWTDLGQFLARRGRLHEAIEMYRRAITVDPGFVVAHNNLGSALARNNQFEEAEETLRKAAAIDPKYAEPWANLAGLRYWQERWLESIEFARRALALRPDLVPAKITLGASMSRLGRLSEAAVAFDEAMAECPGDGEVARELGTELLMLLNYLPDRAAAEVYEAHTRWAKRFAPPPAKLPEHANDPAPEKRIRVAYVSPDFRRHSVNYFVEPFLSNHDHERFEILCYAVELWSDSTTERLKTYADGWRNIKEVDDAALYDLVRRDQVDIFVDLSGHTGHGRLLTFARHPAPVQVTYLGYPATTGLGAMDYRITDSLADPPGMTEAFHSERLVRVDPCFLSYQISDDLPPPHPVPAESRGYVTFGCMNVIMKISKPTIELWAKVLKAVPQSKLLLKFRALTDPSTWSWVVETFAANGIGVDRLELLKHTKTYAEHLDVYGQIDVMLDPFPYNGTTTTCEALAMGLPVVALAGKIHVSRVGVSLLTNVGLPELIAQTPEDYVRICGEFAADLPRLKQLRLGLRDQMRASPLCDAAAFTRRLEAAYRTMWREWCGKQGER